MKTLKKIIDCLESYIKKNFFNLPKTDISHGCEKMLEMNLFDENKNEYVTSEEYATVYKSTTRWQTL
ncbi:MAG: hypothetical protein ACP5D9_18810 [Mariniphaga sp.]